MEWDSSSLEFPGRSDRQQCGDSVVLEKERLNRFGCAGILRLVLERWMQQNQRSILAEKRLENQRCKRCLRAKQRGFAGCLRAVQSGCLFHSRISDRPDRFCPNGHSTPFRYESKGAVRHGWQSSLRPCQRQSLHARHLAPVLRHPLHRS